MSVRLSVCPSFCHQVFLTIRLSVGLSVFPTVRPSICPSFYSSVLPSVCLSVFLTTWRLWRWVFLSTVRPSVSLFLSFSTISSLLAPGKKQRRTIATKDFRTILTDLHLNLDPEGKEVYRVRRFFANFVYVRTFVCLTVCSFIRYFLLFIVWFYIVVVLHEVVGHNRKQILAIYMYYIRVIRVYIL